jgi:CheY-like chemotaxis protein
MPPPSEYRRLVSSPAKSVLIVDDDIDIRETITLILEDEGYVVASAANGEEALHYLRAHAQALPHLILLDLMMPVMDGLEFRAEQQKDPKLATIPVVVITASGNAKERAKSMRANAMIQKPIALDTLLETIEKCIDGANEPPRPAT